MIAIVTGDDISLPYTLTKDGVTFTIDAGATVEVALVALDRTTVLIPAVAQSNATPGADWANSLVVVTMDSHSGSLHVDVEEKSQEVLDGLMKKA